MLTEPILFTGQVHVWWFFGCAVLGCWVMRKARARWPQLGTFGLVIDRVIECLLRVRGTHALRRNRRPVVPRHQNS
jgi:hypothetical protein